jgi:dienelactone hydrolase
MNMRRLAAGAIAVLLTLAPLAAQQAPAPAPAASAASAVQAAQTPAAVAHAVIDAMAAGNFAQVIARLAPSMNALTEDALRTSWTGIIAQAGPLQKQGVERVTPNGALQIVVVPCQFERAPLDVQVVVNASGLIAGLAVSPAVTPAPPYSPPDYAKPASYTEQDVTVGTAPWALPGTLTMPVGTGPFAAVVLVHGSGPNDRDESVGANKPFRDLALGLATRGIAMLRYDKRTRTYGRQMAALTTTTVNDEVIDDVVLAVALLQKTARIDPKRVVVLGHSLGGMLIPRIAPASPSAAGFIVLAGAVRPLEQAILEQTKYLSEFDGVVTPNEQSAIAEVEKNVAAVKALTPTSGPISGVPASYWLDLRGYNPPVAAKAITRPMLILQGERDYQVTPAEYAQWQAALSGSKSATFHLYPGLNHLFIAGVGPANPGEYTRPGHVAEDVIRDIATWIAALPR